MILKMSRYIYLDCFSFKHNMYSQNTPYEFISNIMHPLDINKNLWEVALCEIDWKPHNALSEEDLYVMSDIVARNTQVGLYYPEILRTVRAPTIFNQPYYMDISRDYIDTIKMYIRTATNEPPDKHLLTSVRCVLHFRKK